MSEQTAKKIRLKGHETFILREGWLAKGIRAVADNPKVFSEYSGADALGVGTNMAKAIRYWLKAAGLIEETKNGVELSVFGKNVMTYDSYFEDRFTLWIIHAHIASNAELATSWYVFFNRIGCEEYTRDELVYSLNRELCVYSGLQELPESSVSADVTAIVNMYSRDKGRDYDPEEKKLSPFAELGLLRRDNKSVRKQTPVSEDALQYAVLYLIRKYFEFEGTDSVSIDKLSGECGLPGRIFNLNRVELNFYLDKLAAEEYIAVNRTAGLDMVYLLNGIESKEIIRRYYLKQQALLKNEDR